VIERTRQSTLASIVMVDQGGQIVWGGVRGSYAELPEVRLALEGQARTVMRHNGAYRPKYSFEWLSRASDLRLHYARPIIAGNRVVGALLLSRSPRALFRGIYEDRLKIMAGVIGILLLLVLMAGLISRGVTRPIEALSRASRQVAEGRASAMPEAPATAAIEIRQLYDDFQVMADAIDRRSRYLRDFAAAVSHEFKTPLAGIRGGVELLEDHRETMSPEDQRRFLGNIRADTERLSQLVTRLLDLARADMAQPSTGQAVDILPILRRVADGLSIDGFRALVGPGGLAAVAVPETVVEAVLAAVLENSRQAGAANARIEGAAEGDRLILRVSDDGPGVAVGDRDRLFEPFFTSRRSEGGTGLGLSIARSLLLANQATISLAEGGAGATFEITLPRAHGA
jgi:signal transduction histidine kinase